jgi:hypothetical protein
MVIYTTAQIDAKISALNDRIGAGTASVEHDDKRITYNTPAEIRAGIAYFTAMYPNASDAPVVTTPKVRTVFAFGGKGFGV